MPILPQLQRAAEHYFERAMQRAAAVPPPLPKPIFSEPQNLVRQATQPDRLITVQAAASPLFESAKPLLSVLAQMRPGLQRVQAEALTQRLVREIGSFQSVCHDAGLQHEVIVSASYALCTALDELAGEALSRNERRLRGDASAPSLWTAHALAVRFHGNADGGINVFRIVGHLMLDPGAHLDLLELVWVLLRLGFTGVYRHAHGGQRELDKLFRLLHAAVAERRSQGPNQAFNHWKRVQADIAHGSWNDTA